MIVVVVTKKHTIQIVAYSTDDHSNLGDMKFIVHNAKSNVWCPHELK